MRRRLSSRLTFFDKFVVPLFWIGGFGTAALTIFTGKAQGADGATPVEIAWLCLIVGFGGAIVFAMMSFPLKRVWLDGDVLIVSNGWHSETIPLTNVVGVRSWRLRSPQRVSVSFTQRTRFGMSIVFMPPFSLFWTWGGHPIADELRDAIAAVQPPDSTAHG
jgi:hypothetical protein